MSYLYTDAPQLYQSTIASDGATLSYIDPTEGPQQIPSITGNAGEFLQVNATADNIQWTSFGATGGIDIAQINLADGTALAPSLTFQNEANKDTGIYRDAENSVSVSAGGLQRLQVTPANVTVGTTLNTADLIVRGNVATNSFYAGNGAQATPSFSFSTSGGQDTGMYYNFDSIDRLRFSAGGSFVSEMNAGQCFFNTRVLANSTATNTTPAIIFHNDSSTTGYAGQRTNPSTDPRLWAIVNGVQATELTQTQFNVGLNTANNSQMKELTHNGASTFNTYTPADNLVILPVTAATSGAATGSYFDCDVDPVAGVYAFCNNTTTAGVARVVMTTNPNDLTTWTSLTNNSPASIPLTNVRSICYGNGIWAILSHAGGQRQLCYNTTANAMTTAWTQVASAVPWTTTRTMNRLRFINGQFITLDSGTRFRTSTDCVTWSGDLTLQTGTFSLTDVGYSPQLQRYVITTNAGNIFYYTGTTMPTTNNQFTQVSQTGIASNFITWSPKLSMFLGQNPATFQFNWSRDGINWNSYTPPGTWAAIQNCKWVDDYGGFFIAGLNQTTGNVAISRDGLTWTQHTVLSTACNSLLYNQTARMFLFLGTTLAARYKDNAAFISSYVTNENIYTTFNSNTRFADAIEYQPQEITTAAGDNHYTTTSLTRSVISFDTTASNANILLQGASFAGRVGTRFVIRKFVSSLSNVRIHGYETCRFVSPSGVISSFNFQSSPQVYTIIPAGYFGSFVLERVSDAGTGGVWMVSDVDVYDATGTQREIGGLSVAGDLSVVGTINLTGDLNYVGNPRMSQIELGPSLDTIDADINIPHFVGAFCNKPTPPGRFNQVVLKNLGVNGVGKTFYWFRSTGDVNVACSYLNDSGQDAYQFWWNDTTNREEFIVIANGVSSNTHQAATNYSFSWWKFTYLDINGAYRWIVKQIGSSWE